MSFLYQGSNEMRFRDDNHYLQNRAQYPIIGNRDGHVIRVHVRDCESLLRPIRLRQRLTRDYPKYGAHTIDDLEHDAVRDGCTLSYDCDCQQH